MRHARLVIGLVRTLAPAETVAEPIRVQAGGVSFVAPSGWTAESENKRYLVPDVPKDESCYIAIMPTVQLKGHSPEDVFTLFQEPSEVVCRYRRPDCEDEDGQCHALGGESRAPWPPDLARVLLGGAGRAPRWTAAQRHHRAAVHEEYRNGQAAPGVDAAGEGGQTVARAGYRSHPAGTSDCMAAACHASA